MLHNYVGKDEWSGILLWNIEQGNINDPNNLVIRCKDLFLMDIGSSTYTEFESDAENIIELSNRYPEFEDGDLMTGLIHTHHTMQTNFSGTDDSELKDNTEAYSAYLSLIVNFKMKNTARLAFVVENNIENKYSIKDLFGKIFNIKQDNKERFIAYYDCEIEMEDHDQDWFMERIQKKMEEKKAKNTNYGRFYPEYNYPYMRSYNNQTNKTSKSKTSRKVNLRSFICKVVSLNPQYLGSDVKYAISRMNSTILSNKKKDNSEIRKGYRNSVESVIDSCLKHSFGKTPTEDLVDIMSDAIDMLQDYSNYMVAQELIHYLEEALTIFEPENYLI